ncbi:MAG: TadE family protein [Tepidisphaeraceae bacterium]
MKTPSASRAPSRLRRRARARRGSEILEAALVFPLLLVMAFGTIEFGYYFYLEHNFQAAAREGARARIPVGATDDEIMPAIERIMSASGINADSYEAFWDEIVDGDVSYMQVTVEADWADVGLETGLFVRLHGAGQPQTELVKGNAKIRGMATMRIED